MKKAKKKNHNNCNANDSSWWRHSQPREKCDRSVAAIANATAAILKMFAHSLLMHTQNPYSIHLPFTRVPLAVPLPPSLLHIRCESGGRIEGWKGVARGSANAVAEGGNTFEKSRNNAKLSTCIN